MESTQTPSQITTAQVAKMADILAGATVQMAREQGLSIPAAYAIVRRAFAARWPSLATIVPATLSQLIGHDAALALARSVR